MRAELLGEHLPVHRDLLAELGRGEEESEGVVVGLAEERDPAGPVQVPQSVDHIGGGHAGLFDERSGDREAEPEVGEIIEGPTETLESRSIRPLGDPLEDREVAVDVEVRFAGAEVREPESPEPPRLMEVEIEDDLQGRTPVPRIASR
jgi:hypothetical protein